MAATLAAFWTDSVGWAFVFWQVIPAMLIAMLLIGWGIPQDPTRFERFRQIDLFGMATGCSGVALLVLALNHGERLDWLSSPLIVGMLLTSAALLIVFLINEWFHPLPLFRLQMLSRPNFTHGLLTLAGVLLVALSGSALPSAYFAQVEGFRTAQFAPLALAIGAPQLLIAPFMAMLLNIRWLDCRWMLTCARAAAGGVLHHGFAGDDRLGARKFLADSDDAGLWPADDDPAGADERHVVGAAAGRPFASAMFNTVRGFSSVAAGTLVEWFISHREQFHSHILLDGAASRGWLLSALLPAKPAPPRRCCPTAASARRKISAVSPRWLSIRRRC